MAASKSNGISGGERRRKARAGGAAAGNDSAWLGRVDALAERLSGVEDRNEIVDQVVRETMKLLPADQVVFRADATTVTAPYFIEESEEGAARAVIPLMIGDRHFGAVEIAMKPKRAVGPGERTLSIALARQCALALANLALRQAQTSVAAADNTAPPGAVISVSAAPETAAPKTTILRRPVGEIPTPADSAAAVQAALARVESDLRGLAKLARSADLPPTSWVTEAERNALRHLEELRAQLPGPATQRQDAPTTRN